MELSKYILDLLYRYELVVIPDFGGLLVKSLSAQLDERSHTFFPPSKRLGFNAQLVDNDGLLANHIASVDKVPYETAVNYIKFEVKNLLKKLQDQDVVLDDIGTFSLNAEGNLLFDPNPDANFLTESFGFTNIVSPAVAREEGQEKELEVIFDTINQDIKEEEIAINNEVSRHRLNPLFKYAAILAVIASIGYFGWNKFGNSIQGFAQNDDTKKEQYIKKLQEAKFEIPAELGTISVTVEKEEAAEVDSNTVQTTENQTEEVQNDSSTQTNNTVINEETNPTEVVTKNTNQTSTQTEVVKEPKTVVASTDSSGKYHIIAGAFKSPKNATKKVNQLIAKGYNAHIVGINKWQLTQVAFNSYHNKTEAQNALREIKQNEAKDAWILVK
jgi:cell division septation protein DedD